MIIALTANPIAIGTDVGERAPNVEGKAYNGTTWSDFDFESYFDNSWEEGNVSGQWVVLIFMDTDCPYCQQSASSQTDWANTYNANNPNWNGPHVNFIASATELNIQGTTPAEQKSRILEQNMVIISRMLMILTKTT